MPPTAEAAATQAWLETDVLRPETFDRLAAIAEAASGVVLPRTKQQMVRSRLLRRLRKRGLANFEAYAAMLEQDGGAEMQDFLNAITTNHTGFYREPHHFETLEAALGDWRRRDLVRDPVKIWSAACSSGQEPYSIAMSILDGDRNAKRTSYKVLATDIDTGVLAHAGKGSYARADVERSPRPDIARHFEPAPGNMLVASARLKAMIAFRHLNLLGRWPIKGQFDAIFCRNVIIYFDRETKTEILSRFRQALKPNGLLFLGHSETLSDRDGLTPIGRTTFRKDA